jgi:hypothetical protein
MEPKDIIKAVLDIVLKMQEHYKEKSGCLEW